MIPSSLKNLQKDINTEKKKIIIKISPCLQFSAQAALCINTLLKKLQSLCLRRDKPLENMMKFVIAVLGLRMAIPLWHWHSCRRRCAGDKERGTALFICSCRCCDPVPRYSLCCTRTLPLVFLHQKGGKPFSVFPWADSPCYTFVGPFNGQCYPQFPAVWLSTKQPQQPQTFTKGHTCTNPSAFLSSPALSFLWKILCLKFAGISLFIY